MQSLCDIDLTKTVHDQKVKLLEEEKRERERIEKKRKEELRRKMKQEELARIEKEKMKYPKFVENEQAVDTNVNMGLSDVAILQIQSENEKEMIEIKKIQIEEEEGELIEHQDHHKHLNNKLDESYDNTPDVDSRLEMVMDHDENYENEDPDDEEDIENEELDEDIFKNGDGEFLDAIDNSLSPTAASSRSKPLLYKYFKTSSHHSQYFSIAVIFILFHTCSIIYGVRSQNLFYGRYL